jgi:hypothetical protein
MFFGTHDRSLFDRSGMHVSRHFSTPHTKIGLSFDKPPNIKSTMGFKLDRMVDDQMPICQTYYHTTIRIVGKGESTLRVSHFLPKR